MFNLTRLQSPEQFWALWIVGIGLLLILMALGNTLVKRLPLSPAIIYLCAGFALGNSGTHLLTIDPLAHGPVLEHITETALLISLFSAGLKLNLPLRDQRWNLSIQLATTTLLVTIALLTAVAVLTGIPLGIALLLAAALAPTDPVLASDVQVAHAKDRDSVRFALTGESGLNDGLALPFIALGLLTFTDDPHAFFTQIFSTSWNSAHMAAMQWFGTHVLWSLGSGLALGTALGASVGRVVLYLRTEQKEAVGLDEFLVLGLIALTYGIARLAMASPFLAVFAAGVALTRTALPRQHAPPLPEYQIEKLPDLATNPQHAGALMMRAVLGFNEQIERVAEAIVVIIAGAMIPLLQPNWMLYLIPLLFFIIRPLAVIGSIGPSRIHRTQRRLIAWFGVRGIGSMYYLFYMINHGLPKPLTNPVLSVILGAVVASIIIHGVSVTPLMRRYRRSNRF